MYAPRACASLVTCVHRPDQDRDLHRPDQDRDLHRPDQDRDRDRHRPLHAPTSASAHSFRRWARFPTSCHPRPSRPLPPHVSSLPQLKADGLTIAKLSNAFTLVELKASMGAASLFASAKPTFSLAEFKADGTFGVSELRGAGFTCSETATAGYTATEMWGGGYGAVEMRRAGVPVAQLRSAGAKPADVKLAGYEFEECKSAGYALEELKAAGFVVPEPAPPAPPAPPAGA